MSFQMDDAAWSQAWEAYRQAATMPDDEREEFLSSECLDSEVAAAVRQMLSEAEETIDSPANAGAAPDPHSHPAADPAFGRYELRELIGEGGMGAVYRAVQSRPLRREVALKVLKGNMSKEALARFDVERQALALMDHPNICRVLDAGSTPEGRPYFVMELAAGVPLTQYCQEHKLALAERLGLFLAVCDAIQHAHLKGVIHRDIKPANVLVTDSDGQPLVKVIDFGIAKPFEAEMSAPATEFGYLLGTLEYMSPEQASVGATNVDTRADIYSLGVLLYELLTGSAPLMAAGNREIISMLDRVQNESAQPPSERLRTAARADSLRPGDIRGELDWITLKALAKERERRYQTVNALSRDIQRYQNGEPVEAGPLSTSYRVRKLASRHRVALGTAAAFIVVLVAATILSVRQAARALKAEQDALQERNRAVAAEHAATAERDRAVSAEASMRKEQQAALQAERRAGAQRQVAVAVSDFLQNDLLAQANPNAQTRSSSPPDRSLTVRAALDRASEQIQNRFHDQPEVRAELEQTIARSYHGLGLFAEAEKHARTGYEIRRRLFGPRHAATLDSLTQIGAACRAQGRYREAAGLWEEVLEVQKRTVGSNDASTLRTMNNLAAVYRNLGRIKDSEALYRQSLEGRRRILGETHPDTLVTANNLGVLYMYNGRAKEAEPLHRDVLRARESQLGPRHPDTLISQHNIAMSLMQLSRVDDAIPLFTETAAGQEKVLGPLHVDTVNTLNNLTVALEMAGRIEETATLRDDVLGRYLKSLGERHSYTLNAMHNLGLSNHALGRFEAAGKLFLRTLEIRKETLGADHPDTLESYADIANYYVDVGEYSKAEAFASEGLERCRRRLGEDSRTTLHTASTLAAVLASTERYSEAERLIDESLTRSRRVAGERSRTTITCTVPRLLVMLGRGEYEQAATSAQELAEIATASLGRRHTLTLQILETRARARHVAGQHDPAEQDYRDLVSTRQTALGPTHPKTLDSVRQLASLLHERGKAQPAEELLRQVVERATPDYRALWQYTAAEQLLGRTLLTQRRYAEAEPFLVSSFEKLIDREQSMPAIERALVPASEASVVELFEKWQKPEKLREWSARSRASANEKTR